VRSTTASSDEETHVATKVKRSVYCGLVLAMLLYGAEHWCLTAKIARVLRAFHHPPSLYAVHVLTEPLAHTPNLARRGEIASHASCRSGSIYI
jgi:hypothetical protein